MKNAPFVDWLTIRQHHIGAAPLPFFLNGVRSFHSREGICKFERAVPESVRGSWDSALNVQCDGAHLLISGNVGRFGRPDNVFNLRWRETLEALERVCVALAVPPFSATRYAGVSELGGTGHYGAIVSRVDITKNFRTGSDAQARAFIRHLQGIAVSRAKRGLAGDESVWWVNTRRMVKAYNKAADLLAHGGTKDSRIYEWCRDNGIVRIEVELKRRLLADLDMQHLPHINDERLSNVYDEETDFLSRFDSSDEPDILAAIPTRSRAIAAAWLAGQDVASFVSRATLYRHAKICRGYGLDLFQRRNVEAFPTKVRVIELEQVEAPEWYEWNKKESA